MSRSHANPPGTQDQQGDLNSRPAREALETLQVNTYEVEALRLTNQRLLRNLEELTRQMQRPQEERQHHDSPRDADGEGESSQAKKHDPYKPPREDHNEGIPSRNNRGNGLILYQPEIGERSWEQRFRDIQQELSHMKKTMKGRAPVSMDALVQQTKSPFMAGVLHFPLPAKFRMPQIETFKGTKDPVDDLNTYKNQMKLHGYQDPVRCRAFTITLKGPTLAWFNRLPSSSISSFRELSIAFVSHFIGARTYRKSSYHLLTIKQSPQKNLKSYVQRLNAKSLRVDIPDEKVATTAFIAGLGIQSKDLMFSISKNPQENMAEVLAKVEKYINNEEAFLSK